MQYLMSHENNVLFLHASCHVLQKSDSDLLTQKEDSVIKPGPIQ